MKSTTITQNTASSTEQGANALFRNQFNDYLAKQHPVVRALHTVLMGLSIFCILLAVVFFCVALYQTVLWATTGSFTSLGKATSLPIAWVNFGLSMSFLVFPWGLDSMLMRVFPAIVFLVAWYRSNKPIQYKTGLGAFFAGFGIMCAGAPGAVYIVPLLVRALQNIF
jgi:hypothetical protein